MQRRLLGLSAGEAVHRLVPSQVSGWLVSCFNAMVRSICVCLDYTECSGIMVLRLYLRQHGASAATAQPQVAMHVPFVVQLLALQSSMPNCTHACTLLAQQTLVTLSTALAKPPPPKSGKSSSSSSSRPRSAPSPSPRRQRVTTAASRQLLPLVMPRVLPAAPARHSQRVRQLVVQLLVQGAVAGRPRQQPSSSSGSNSNSSSSRRSSRRSGNRNQRKSSRCYRVCSMKRRGRRALCMMRWRRGMCQIMMARQWTQQVGLAGTHAPEQLARCIVLHGPSLATKRFQRSRLGV